MDETRLTFEAMKERLAGENLKQVAEETSLHYNTVYRFLHSDKDPKYSTLKEIDRYFKTR